jgi:hypothetical protein
MIMIVIIFRQNIFDFENLYLDKIYLILRTYIFPKYSVYI